ncbi:MAG: type II toxin-antitoxin system prevent-host-death family antitoxin [Desulfovibrionales bacterium]|nr:MAG: type II toxin-antitoxin system prevent-host-death family antitoxin [Desulfovibrionales bacterium]
MTTVTLTEFRSHASDMLSRMEKGEIIVVVRYGKPIAEVSPIRSTDAVKPSWERPALRLSTKGAARSTAILAEREHENLT